MSKTIVWPANEAAERAARSSATRSDAAPLADAPHRSGLTPLAWSGGVVAGVLAMLYWQMK